jgi:hypothetical protein
MQEKGQDTKEINDGLEWDWMALGDEARQRKTKGVNDREVKRTNDTGRRVQALGSNLRAPPPILTKSTPNVHSSQRLCTLVTISDQVSFFWQPSAGRI